MSSADAILPVVGSTAGAHGANFKTGFQMNNRTDEAMSGWLVFHSQGVAATAGDAKLHYDLPPHATLAADDVVAEMGASGLGSMDLVVEQGDVPTIVARAYDDQESGTTGVMVPLFDPARALAMGDSLSLIVPRDLERFRFNIGVRTLDQGATVAVVVRGEDGIVRSELGEMTWPAGYFIQQPANQFTGVALLPNESIGFQVVQGSAIIYGTTVDNSTNDSSIQILQRRNP
ncbi:MAG: hypothetical protein WBX15_05940 [Thermoanaerobaculia bacterium]